MTAQNAIDDIRIIYCDTCEDEHCEDCLFQASINALEKQIPRKPIDTSKNPTEWHVMTCPICGRVFWNSGQFVHYQPMFCGRCGQEIDWSKS